MTSPMGKKLKWQSRQIIFNLQNYFKERKRDKSSVEYEEDINVNNITAEAAGVCCKTVSKITTEGLSLQSIYGQALFMSADKRENKKPKKRLPMDCFIQGLIRRRVLQAQAESKTPISLNGIAKIMHDEDIVKTSNEYLRILLIKIGFTHKTKKRILVEEEGFASHRTEFLNNINKFREDGRNIVYVDEMYFNLDQSKPLEWNTDNDANGVLCYSGKGQGLIVLHAGTVDGFLKNILQFIKTIDVRNCDINYEVFKEWVKEKLLPNLEENSVVVMDNAEYHFPAQNTHEMEKIFFDNGHTLVRMPLSHQDLNPLELIWRDIKQTMFMNKDIFFNQEDLQKRLEKLLNNYPQDKWDSSIAYVTKVEAEYFALSSNLTSDDHMVVDEENNVHDEIDD